MLNIQQVIERSIYSAILDSLIEAGLSLDPNNYLPLSLENSAAYKVARENIEASKGMYIELYGSSDSLSKGAKSTPRIVIVPQGFYPGDMGLEHRSLDLADDTYVISELPFESIDQNYDIIIVANNITEQRVLTSIISSSIPRRGYIKPYNKEPATSGNIFILLSNYFNSDNNEAGTLEKVYQFTVKDTLIEEPTIVDTATPMIDISLLLSVGDIDVDTIEVKSLNNNL